MLHVTEIHLDLLNRQRSHTYFNSTDLHKMVGLDACMPHALPHMYWSYHQEK
jgi:hypothetical protein